MIGFRKKAKHKREWRVSLGNKQTIAGRGDGDTAKHQLVRPLSPDLDVKKNSQKSETAITELLLPPAAPLPESVLSKISI